MSQTYTKSQYDNMDKRRRIAWAKYYELEGEQANQTNIIVSSIGRKENGELNLIPKHITEEFYDMATKLNKKYTCPICIDLVDKTTIDITYCGHIFHKECLNESKKSKNQCPMCRKKLF
jgi:rubrerythrin